MQTVFRKPEQTRFQYNVNGTNVFLTTEQASRLVGQGLSVMRTDGRSGIMFTDAAVLRGLDALKAIQVLQ
jgi:hypothetical protein